MDRGEHAEGQHIDFQQAERVEIVLVPLNYRTFGHGGVFDRHQVRQRTTRDHEAADMLREMARKSTQGVSQSQPFGDPRCCRVKTDRAQAVGKLLALVPPGQ